MKGKKIFFSLLFFTLLFFVGAKETLAAKLYFNPASKDVTTGETFTASVMLDTQGEAASSTDAIVLYDSAKLTVVSASLGDLFANKIQEDYLTTGKVIFRATAPSGSPFTGSGVFAAIQFKAFASGKANVSFQFDPGSTIDSNVGKQGTEGEDILTTVQGAEYSIDYTGTGNGDSGVGGGTTEATQTSTPTAGFVSPTILLASLGFLLLLIPLFI